MCVVVWVSLSLGVCVCVDGCVSVVAVQLQCACNISRRSRLDHVGVVSDLLCSRHRG